MEAAPRPSAEAPERAPAPPEAGHAASPERRPSAAESGNGSGTPRKTARRNAGGKDASAAPNRATAVEGPDLPEVYTVRFPAEIPKVFKRVGKELVHRGRVPAWWAAGVLKPLAGAIRGRFAPGMTVDVHPRGIYWKAVDLYAERRPTERAASELKEAHDRGALRDYGADRP